MASQCVVIYQGERYVGKAISGTSAADDADAQSSALLQEGVSFLRLADGGVAVFGKEAGQRAVYVYHDVPEPAGRRRPTRRPG